MVEVTNVLGLTFEQTRLMYSIQYQIIKADCYVDEYKVKWLKEWTTNIEEFLKLNLKESNLNNSDYHILKESKEVVCEINNLKSKIVNDIAFKLIILECALFEPYYILNNNEEKNKKYKKLKLKEEKRLEVLDYYSRILNIKEDEVRKYQKSYKKAKDGLSGRSKKIAIGALLGGLILAVSGGVAATAIAPLFAAPGLFGAAAITSGLAALGGGAIAAGGLGMAGGLAVIVGGGAILGIHAGAGIGALASLGKKFVISNAAKLEVVIKEILLGSQRDTVYIQEILNRQREVIEKLQGEIIKLRRNSDKNNGKIKELEECIKILEKVIKRNMAL